MSNLDITAETTIAAERARVAAYAMDPSHDPVWIGGITEAEVLTGGALGPGSRVRRIASFLGRRIVYVMEIVGFEPAARLEMRAIESPFPMQVTYSFEDLVDRTLASIRVRGAPGGAYRLAGPLLPGMVRRSVAGDLRRLKRIMERA
jgi:hypothetical protein